MRLCLALGYPSPRHLLRELTATEVTDWMAYEIVEPWGEGQADVRSALIAHTIACVNTPRNKRPKLTAFMPQHEQRADRILEMLGMSEYVAGSRPQLIVARELLKTAGARASARKITNGGQA